MKTVVLQEPVIAVVEEIADSAHGVGEVLVHVKMVGLCGSDLNTFRGTNPMVTYPGVRGLEIALPFSTRFKARLKLAPV